MAEESSSPPIAARAGRFFDSEGRQVILHGANLVNKDPKAGYLGPETAADFAAMRRWGLNTVRLGVIWDGLEPEPGVYGEAYLEGIARQVDLAAEQGLYVFLDMHQDLYSVLYSDGAPEWATLAGGQPHVVEGGVWSDAYFTSPAVQAALDNFWRNAPAPDGVGLQEHYAAAWAHVVQRFAGHPAVIGYDLMNEPFPGSAAVESQYRLFAAGAALLEELDGPPSPSPEELAMRWLDPDQRALILLRLNSADRFARVVDAAVDCYAEFERELLMPFYRRVASAIRAHDPRKILFLEASMGSNMGVYSAIEPLAGPDGTPDPNQAYAPHGYDLVVDTAHLVWSSAARVKLIFSRHGETAARLGLSMLVGEWGAFGHQPGTQRAARMVARLFERLLCSDTYWTYERGLNRLAPFRAICRPYPERVAGTLNRYSSDVPRGTFTCRWTEPDETGAYSRFYLPAWTRWRPQRIQLEPDGSPYTIETDASGNAWVHVPPTGGKRIFRLLPRKR